MAVPFEPGDDERCIAATVAVAEPEAIVALEALRSAPADEWNPELVGQGTDGDRVVGAVRARDPDAALLDQVLESVGRVLGRALREAIFGVQYELDRTIEQSFCGRFVERQPVDLVVAAVGPVERGTEPSDLDRFHCGSLLRAGRLTGYAYLIAGRAGRCSSAARPGCTTRRRAREAR